jgi:hypothetical protein
MVYNIAAKFLPKKSAPCVMMKMRFWLDLSGFAYRTAAF